MCKQINLSRRITCFSVKQYCSERKTRIFTGECAECRFVKHHCREYQKWSRDLGDANRERANELDETRVKRNLRARKRARGRVALIQKPLVRLETTARDMIKCKCIARRQSSLRKTCKIARKIESWSEPTIARAAQYPAINFLLQLREMKYQI